MKKKTLIALSTASALILATAIFAQVPPTETTLLQQIAGELSSLPASITNGVTSGMSSGFGDLETSLETFLNDLYKDVRKWVHERDHAYNPNTSSTIALNSITVPVNSVLPSAPTSTLQLTLSQAIDAQAQQGTSNNVQNSLSQFSYSLNQQDTSHPIKTAEGELYSQYLLDNSTQSLILGSNAQASDSLYLSNSATAESSLAALDSNNKSLLTQTGSLHDNQFDFSNVIIPMAYTPAQQQDAHRFLTYAMLNTKSLLGDVSFTKLYGNAKALISLKQSSEYQSYMLTIRNMIAVRSISLNIFNQLVAERTPIPNLGQAIGQQSGSAASPLQVEEYRATHDLNNPAWYSSLQNEEPATVQRDILITLKEIERQNFQTQMQNERLLSMLLAMSMQSGSTADTALQMQQTKLQSAIKTAEKVGEPAKPHNTTAAGALSSGVIVQSITNGTANISWGAVSNASGTVKYTVTVTDQKNNQVFNQTTNSTQIQAIGLTPGTTYNVTVSPNQGSGGQASFSTTGTAPKT